MPDIEKQFQLIAPHFVDAMGDPPEAAHLFRTYMRDPATSLYSSLIDWMERHGYTRTVESKALFEETSAIQIVRLIDELREEPGASVEILCLDEEGTWPHVVGASNSYTSWMPRRWDGRTLLEALEAAAAHYREGKQKKQAELRVQGWPWPPKVLRVWEEYWMQHPGIWAVVGNDSTGELDLDLKPGDKVDVITFFSAKVLEKQALITGIDPPGVDSLHPFVQWWKIRFDNLPGRVEQTMKVVSKQLEPRPEAG